MSQGTVKEKICAVLRSSEDKVFLRSEFASFGSANQVGRVISVGKTRVRRKIGFGKRVLVYERS